MIHTRQHTSRLAYLLLLLAALALFPGCGGCNSTNPKPLTPEEREKQAEEEKKKKEEQDKPDFEQPKISALPEAERCSLKPGHWVELRQHSQFPDQQSHH